MNVRASSLFFTMINDFLQIWGNRRLYYHEGRYPVLEGYWGVVMFAEDVTVNVYLGRTPEQIIERMNNVLSVCLYEG